MKLICTIIVILFVTSCCKLPITTSTTEKDSVQIITEIKYRDTPVYINRQVTIYDTIPCPEVNYTNEKKEDGLKTKVVIRNGKLTVDCKADSLKVVITGLRDELTKITRSKEKVITVTIPVKVKEWYVPWWVYILVIGTIAYWINRVNGFQFLAKLISKLK